MLNTFAIAAGQMMEFHEPGDFFRIMAASDPVTVRYYRNGKEISEAPGVGRGYAERFLADQFDRITIHSATAQTLQVVVRLGHEVAYDVPPVGDVQVTNTPGVTVLNVRGAFAQSAVAVGVASAVIAPANAARRYLMVINNHATAQIWLNVAGGTASAASGITLGPGDSYELQGYVPTGAITAIASATATAVVVEG